MSVWLILPHVWSWAPQTEQTQAHGQENIFSRHHNESRHQGETEIDCEPLMHKTAFRKWLSSQTAGSVITNAAPLIRCSSSLFSFPLTIPCGLLVCVIQRLCLPSQTKQTETAKLSWKHIGVTKQRNTSTQHLLCLHEKHNSLRHEACSFKILLLKIRTNICQWPDWQTFVLV